MLTVEGLSSAVLAPASFTLAEGECVVVRGESGSGKTVLLRALADLDPSVGRVSLDGVLRDEVPAPVWRRRVRYMAAEPAWWHDRVACHFADWPAARPLAERLRLPAGIGEAPLARLSTGERQRLALLRALQPAPRVLLADEPTAALDAAAVSAVEELIGEMRAAGMGVLWVSHDPAQARRVACRALEVVAGAVRAAAL